MDKDLVFQVLSEKEKVIQENLLNSIKLNNEELADKYEKKLKDIDTESKLKIAFVGQHNAGKSTMVSALTKNKEIKISSNVETDDTTQYEWGDVIIYDTPGLYAGVKAEHDISARLAIQDSDILIFCITSSLFDDLIIKDFVDQAYNKSYKNKIILAVNKMSQEDRDYDELVINYTKTLSNTLKEIGGNLEDFPIAFFDAKDYKDGIDDEDEELIEISHFESFISLLNQEIDKRGLTAKVITKCNILNDAISEAISAGGTETDKSFNYLIDRLIKTVRKNKKDMKYRVEGEERNLSTTIQEIGNSIVDKIGNEEITEKDEEAVGVSIEKAVDNTVEKIETMVTQSVEEMDNEIGEILSSDMAMHIFKDIDFNDVDVVDASVKDLKNFVDKYGVAAKFAREGGQKLSKMALAEGATNFTKLASTSGSTMHKVVLGVGHFFGKSFKPYEAIKIARGIGRAAAVIGPIVSVLDIVMTLGGKVKEEKDAKMVESAKTQTFNGYSSLASDIQREISKQYSEMEKEIYDLRIEELQKVKEDKINEMKSGTIFVDTLKNYMAEIKDIMAVSCDANI